jgi:hypothetical protein
VVEPYVLYKNAFGLSPQKFYLKNYGMISVFLIALIGEYFVLQNLTNVFTEMVVNGLISIACSTILCGMILFLNKNQIKQLMKTLKKRQ